MMHTAIALMIEDSTSLMYWLEEYLNYQKAKEDYPYRDLSGEECKYLKRGCISYATYLLNDSLLLLFLL